MDSAIDLDTPAGASALSAPRGKLGLALAAAAAFCVVVGAAYAVIGRLGLPGYGTWTGVRPLEHKLEMLQAFSARGDVDALVLGSSIVEFGFSARLFSDLMSRRLGREYRAFNFGTGAAEIRTMPKLYRLARTVSKPKAVFVVVPPEAKLLNYIYERTPDIALQRAPIGPFLRDQSLLDLDKALWDAPLLKYAPAARDKALFGAYHNLQGVGMEAYAVDANGDRVSYLMTWSPDELPTYKRSGQLAVAPFDGATSGMPHDDPVDFYFAKIDVDAMDELRRLVERDGGHIHVISHSPAAGLWGGPADDPRYAEGRRAFFAALSARLGAKFVDAAGAVDVPTYAISDITHLNAYGAEIYTRAAFAAFVGADAAEARTALMRPPPKGLFPTTDKTFTPYAALVRRPAHEADPLLRVKLVDTLAVPPLPNQPLYVALRMPDNQDVVAPAIPIGPHEFVAEVNLPSVAEDEGLVLRIVHGDGASRVASNHPLEDYEWIASFPRKPLPASGTAGEPQLVAWPPVRSPGQSLYIGVKPGAAPPASLALRLEPRSGAAPALDLGTASGDFGKLVKVALPADAAPGEYVLRARDAATQKPLDPAPVVKIVR